MHLFSPNVVLVSGTRVWRIGTCSEKEEHAFAWLAVEAGIAIEEIVRSCGVSRQPMTIGEQQNANLKRFPDGDCARDR